MRKKFAIALAAALLATMFTVIAAFAADSDAYNITLEDVSYQTITGWGVFPASVPAESNHVWFNATTAHKALFEDLGINMYRIELRGNCGNADGSLVETPLAAFRKTIELAKAHNQTNYLVTIWTPPAGMKSNNNISGKNGDGTAARLLQNKENAFCSYIINVLKDLEAKNLPLPSAFSIQNEPNNAFDYQSCFYDKEQYKRVTILMRSALDAAGYTGIKLVGPEAPQYKDSYMWLGDDFAELTGDSAYANSLDILASHSYLNKNSTKKADIDAFVSNAQQFPNKEIWQTEFSTIHSGAGSSEMDRAIDAIRTFTTDVAYVGTNAWFWWLGWGDTRYPLNDAAGVQESLTFGNNGATAALELGLNYQAFAKVWNNAPEGSTVLRLTSNDPDVVDTSEPESDLVGFLADGKNVILFTNPTNKAKVYNFNNLKGKSAEIWTMSSKADGMKLASKKTLTSAGTLEKASIPARSISVIITSLTDLAPPAITYVPDKTLALDNDVYVSRTQNITVEFSLDESAGVTVNGVATEVSSGLTFAKELALTADVTVVTITATDSSNNASTQTFKFRYDPTFVKLELTQLNAKSISDSYTVTGKVNVASTITAKQGDVVAGSGSASADLTFSFDLPLVDGTNTFVLTAVDAGSNSSLPQTLTVICDQSVPVITLSSASFETSDIEIILDGSISEEVASFTVNGVEWVSRLNGLNFSIKALLEQDGANTITFVATDENGNAGVLAQTVTLSKTSATPRITEGIAYAHHATVSVDGDLDESDWAIEYKARKSIGTKIANNIVNFGVLYDDDYLYIGAKVYDTALFFDEDRSFINDGIELFINPSGAKGGEYEAHDKQLFIGFTKGDTSALVGNGAGGYLSGFKFIDGGYSCEFAIPWSSMGITSPAPGLEIGFDLQNDDKESLGSGAVHRDSQIVWNGTADNWQTTKFFGSIILDDPSYSIDIGSETASGAGYARTVTINGGFLSGKCLIVKTSAGSGTDARIIVYSINAAPSVVLSYSEAGAATSVWLADATPGLTADDLGGKVYASASSQ
ncbi:MAG: hypothetical protein LBT59_17035 [Clostridiales bacterium]|nr:hypothetical protein [Clostridiales bacterium]